MPTHAPSENRLQEILQGKLSNEAPRAFEDAFRSLACHKAWSLLEGVCESEVLEHAFFHALKDSPKKLDLLDRMTLQADLVDLVRGLIDDNAAWEKSKTTTLEGRFKMLHIALAGEYQEIADLGKIAPVAAEIHQHHWIAQVALKVMRGEAAEIRHECANLRDALEIMVTLSESIDTSREDERLQTFEKVFERSLRIAGRTGALLRSRMDFFSQNLDAFEAKRLEMFGMLHEAKAKAHESHQAKQAMQAQSEKKDEIKKAHEAARPREISTSVNVVPPTPVHQQSAPAPSTHYEDRYFDDYWELNHNPSTGLPMISGSGVDVSGHAFGTGDFGGGW